MVEEKHYYYINGKEVKKEVAKTRPISKDLLVTLVPLSKLKKPKKKGGKK